MTQLRSNPLTATATPNKNATHTMLYDELADEYKRRAVETLQSGSLDTAATLITEYASGTQLLELGVGGGAMMSSMNDRGFVTTGIDISSKMIENAQSLNPHGSYFTGEYQDVKFNKSFDVIIGLAFIHLFDKEESSSLLTKIYNDLTDDGIVYLSTTVEDSYEYNFFNKDDYGDNLGRWRAKHTPHSFISLLEGTGLTLRRFGSSHSSNMHGSISGTHTFGKDRMYMIASK